MTDSSSSITLWIPPGALADERYMVGIDPTAHRYYEDPCHHPSLTQSIAHVLVTQSPAHAWEQHPKFGGRSKIPTADMREGSMVDQLLLEGERRFVVIESDSYRTKAARLQRDEATANGLIPILTEEYAEAQARVDAIRVRLELAGVDLTAGRKQVAVYWVETADDGTLVQCRGLLDQLDALLIRDLKKSIDGSPRKVAKTIEKYGYDIQCAAYLSGVGHVLPDAMGRVKFEWVFCEPEAPHSVTRLEPAGSMLELGRLRWRHAVNVWARCLKTRMFPGYEEQGLIRVEASPWALEEAQRLAEEADERAA